MPLEVPFICNIVVKCHYLFQYIYFIGKFIVNVLFLNMLLLLLLFMLF